MLTPILQIDGKAELSFDVPSLYKSVEYIYSEEFDTSDYVDINVQVTELLTGNYYYLNLKCNIWYRITLVATLHVKIGHFLISNYMN